MLSTFDIPVLEGRVCYLTQTEENQYPTVECYYRNLACRFTIPKDFELQVGNWIRFSGKVRLDIKVKKNGDLAEKPVYYHEPYDGSNRKSWLFFELLDASYQLIGSTDVMELIYEAINKLESHKENWENNLSEEKLKGTLNSLLNLTTLLEKELKSLVIAKEEKRAKVTTVDISV